MILACIARSIHVGYFYACLDTEWLVCVLVTRVDSTNMAKPVEMSDGDRLTWTQGTEYQIGYMLYLLNMIE